MKHTTILFLLLLSVAPSRANLLMRPWLQGVTMHSVWVLAECNSPQHVRVLYGTDQQTTETAEGNFTLKTTARPATWVHQTRLTALIPGTRYYYRVIHGTDTSMVASFFTAVEPGTPFRLAWMAGCRADTDIFRQIILKVLQADPMVALLGGDLCSTGSYPEWKKEFFTREFQQFGQRVPFFNTPGRFEGWSRLTRAFTCGPGSETEQTGYYSFEYGDVHVLCLNQEVSLKPGSAQYDFALQDLKTSVSPWKLVMAHRPAYCGGGHGNDETMIRLTSELFEPAGVDVVLAGHPGFYQRNVINRIQHIISGSAGAPVEEPQPVPQTVSQSGEYSYLIIDAARTKLKIYAYNLRGEIIDSVILEKPGRD